MVEFVVILRVALGVLLALFSTISTLGIVLGVKGIGEDPLAARDLIISQGLPVFLLNLVLVAFVGDWGSILGI